MKERVSVIIEWIVAGIKRGPVAIPRIAVIGIIWVTVVVGVIHRGRGVSVI
jgi:hypothetical protein